eukprot:12913756-Prorocentrum_lima.AAC.1
MLSKNGKEANTPNSEGFMPQDSIANAGSTFWNPPTRRASHAPHRSLCSPPMLLTIQNTVGCVTP